MKKYYKHVLLIVSVLFAMGLVPLSANNQDYQQQFEQASVNANNAMQVGPKIIDLEGLATLDLDEAYGYIPAKETKALFELLGNDTHGIMGAITGNPDVDPDSQWFVVLTYNDSGHVMDDDAKTWDTDELLSSIKTGTDAANEVRAERGFARLNVLGWVEPPHYDALNNRMAWSIKAQSEGDTIPGINFNTLALSKEGYMSMNLVTQLERIEQDRVISENLLNSLNFKPGFTYSEFNPDTDRIAEYGLAALVTGVAAKKLGLFAVIAAFLAKFAKIIIATVAGGGAYFFKRRKNEKKARDSDDVE